MAEYTCGNRCELSYLILTEVNYHRFSITSTHTPYISHANVTGLDSGTGIHSRALFQLGSCQHRLYMLMILIFKGNVFGYLLIILFLVGFLHDWEMM